jgi:hypothetical protein
LFASLPITYGATFTDELRTADDTSAESGGREAEQLADLAAEQIGNGHQFKIAKAPGLTIPATPPTCADQVIE